jgi:SRSO17 transposase
MVQTADGSNVLDPQRWGLPLEAVEDLAERLWRIWSRFRFCFRIRTSDSSEHAYHYLHGILTMETDRNYANIARRVIDSEDDGQNLQHFMSDSPWSAQAVFDQIQAEICQRPDLDGGMLTLDESGDKCAGDQKAGAGRQWLGRLGKVDLGQVGVGTGYYKDGNWAMVDVRLFMLKDWFDDDHTELRERWHVPDALGYKTKLELGLEMIKRAQENGLPFRVVGCDSLYGRSKEFRADLDGENLIYMADVPVDTPVYLEKPIVGVPETPPHKKGPSFSRPRVLSVDEPVEVQDVAKRSDTVFQTIEVRHIERGVLIHPCAARWVWTITEEGKVREEWLFIRRESDGSLSYSLSNAAPDTPLKKLALWRSWRYFAERIFQDGKSEAGWDELEARKYRAWLHHTALTALALWFVAETKLDWAKAHPCDPELAEQLEVEVLPTLSVANVRELLRAVLPLKQLSPEKAACLVVKHLVNRSRSTSCRLKKQRAGRSPP